MSSAKTAVSTGPDRRVSMAPMMDCTDRHDRYLMRLISSRLLLYTEMVVTGALIHGDAERFLQHHPHEGPVALQLGGSEPAELASCARMGVDAGYDEINLNVGCPSDRVQAGRFGACLMLEPELVGDCVRAMREVVDVPVTVKCRIGVDDQDSYEALVHFVRTVVDAGCETLIVHARKAWLSGLSPRQNREIPPLDYPRVYQLKQDFPGLEVVINGGIETLGQTRQQLDHTDGVMIGRAAYANPYMLIHADELLDNMPGPFLPSRDVPSRAQIVHRYCEYIDDELRKGTFLKHMSRHLFGLYLGQPGARAWRRTLSEGATDNTAGLEVIHAALAHVEDTSPSVVNG